MVAWTFHLLVQLFLLLNQLSSFRSDLIQQQIYEGFLVLAIQCFFPLSSDKKWRANHHPIYFSMLA
uniref:Secreted protein n=1 Tax=Octopus bimaculoides TaxID=37653 RepID=A0A0L8GP79_OCTBM